MAVLSVNVSTEWIFTLCNFQMEMFVSMDAAGLSPGATINIGLCLEISDRDSGGPWCLETTVWKLLSMLTYRELWAELTWNITITHFYFWTSGSAQQYVRSTTEHPSHCLLNPLRRCCPECILEPVFWSRIRTRFSISVSPWGPILSLLCGIWCHETHRVWLRDQKQKQQTLVNVQGQILLWSRSSHSPSWLEFTLSPRRILNSWSFCLHWNSSITGVHLMPGFMWCLGIQSKDLFMLGKHSIGWVTSPVPTP